MFCICIDGYKMYQGNDYDKIYDALSKLKYKKFFIFQMKSIKMCDNPHFVQNYSSKIARGI